MSACAAISTASFYKANVDALIKAKEKDDRDAAERDAADAAAADKVKALIEALPDAEKVTTADKEAIEAARAAYDNLTAGQKARISESMLRKLTDAEYALKEAGKADKRTITALILTGTTYRYNGKTHKPAIAYVIAGDRIVGPDGYDVSYSDSDSADAGEYTVTVTGKDQYTGTATADYTISKASNPVKINKKTGNIKIRKGLGKGTYKVKVKVTSSGAPNYNAKSKNVTIKITVK
ncbi:MAG: cadherin repeat domain-containing protein [Eubacterium sp.]|nr:cadherin repeat domain-containing protein [Eubacterium sp.]